MLYYDLLIIFIHRKYSYGPTAVEPESLPNRGNAISNHRVVVTYNLALCEQIEITIYKSRVTNPTFLNRVESN